MGPSAGVALTKKINTFEIYSLADSGASRSILPKRLVAEKNLPFKEAKNEILLNASQQEMNISGALKIQVSFGKRSTILNALITDEIFTPILSWFDSAKLGLLREIEKNVQTAKAVINHDNILKPALRTSPPMKLLSLAEHRDFNSVTQISKNSAVGLDELALKKQKDRTIALQH